MPVTVAAINTGELKNLFQPKYTTLQKDYEEQQKAILTKQLISDKNNMNTQSAQQVVTSVQVAKPAPTVAQQQEAIDACSSLIDYYNKILTSAKQPNASVSAIQNALTVSSPQQLLLFNNLMAGTTDAQLKTVSDSVADEPNNINDVISSLNQIITALTNLKDELNQQVSLENILTPPLAQQTTTTTTTPTTATQTVQAVAVAPTDYTMYYIIGGVAVVGIAAYLMMKK